MSLTINDIDDISFGVSQVIIAMGTKRYLFGNLEQAFIDNLKRDQLGGRLAHSSEARALIQRIPAGNVAPRQHAAKRDLFCLSSRIVTIIAKGLVPLTNRPLSALIGIASAICFILAVRNGLGDRLGGFSRTMDVLDIVTVLAVYISSIFIHEFGHAVLCLKKTGLVGSISVRLSRGLPVFATDVSSLHLTTRASQAKIAIAGVLFQICFASFLLMSPIVAVQVGATLALLAALFSLLPFPRSDGFWFISDILGIDLSRTFREASLTRKLFHIYTFWLVTAQILIWYILLYSGVRVWSTIASDRQIVLSDATLWAVYILYTVLVVSSHAIRTVGFLRNGTLGRWDRGTATD